MGMISFRSFSSLVFRFQVVLVARILDIVCGEVSGIWIDKFDRTINIMLMLDI